MADSFNQSLIRKRIVLKVDPFRKDKLMKTFVLSIVLMLFVAQSKSQVLITFADTANYLMNIENKKANYISKSFSVLYDTLKVKPVWIITDDANVIPTFGKNYASFLIMKEHLKKTIFLS